MRRVLQLLAMAVVAWPAGVWAQAPKDGIVISGEDVKAVLKYAVDTKRTTVDNTIRVIDMGAYQLSVAVVHRGPTGRPAAAGAAASAAATAPANPQPACGEARPGVTGPGGIAHDDTAETYIVISGSAVAPPVTLGTWLRGQWPAVGTGQRSDDHSERAVVQRDDGGIHEPRGEGGRHHRDSRARPARVLDDRGPRHLPERAA